MHDLSEQPQESACVLSVITGSCVWKLTGKRSKKFKAICERWKKDKTVDSGSVDRKAKANSKKVDSSIKYKNVEASTAEIEKEAQIFIEAVHIKKILKNIKFESDQGSSHLDKDAAQRNSSNKEETPAALPTS
ncbi:hypothetical protein AgCh_036613 [Apium graveolens]